MRLKIALFVIAAFVSGALVSRASRAIAQTTPKSTSWAVYSDETLNEALSVWGKDGQLVMKIERDGRVIFGKGVTPNEAARSFSEALRDMGGCASVMMNGK